MSGNAGNRFDRNAMVHHGHDASPVLRPPTEDDGETAQRRPAGWARIIKVLCVQVGLAR